MQAQGGEIAQRMLIVQIQILAAAAAACRLQRSGERRAGGTLAQAEIRRQCHGPFDAQTTMSRPQIELGGVKAFAAAIACAQACAGIAVLQKPGIQQPVRHELAAPATIDIVLQPLAPAVAVGRDIGQRRAQIKALGQGQFHCALHGRTLPGLRDAAKAVVTDQAQRAGQGRPAVGLRRS